MSKKNLKVLSEMVEDEFINAVAYLRVSTKGQVDQYGLDAQEDAVYNFADKEGYTIVKCFYEEGVSGSIDTDAVKITKNDDEVEENLIRIAWADMELYMKENNIDTIIIPRLDRLARDLMVQETIIGKAMKEGWSIISTQEKDLCFNDPTRKMIRQFMGIINEYDKAMIVARLKAGQVSKAKKGQHAIGRIALGYKTEITGKTRVLVVNKDEIEAIHDIFRLRDEDNLSYQKIADYLNEKGIKPKQGGQMFYPSTVRKIYMNSKYRGIVTLHRNNELVVEAENENLRLI